MCAGILSECVVWPAFFFVFWRNIFTKCNSVGAHLTSCYANSYDSASYGFHVRKKNFSENFGISLDISESYGKLYFMVRNTASATRR